MKIGIITTGSLNKPTAESLYVKEPLKYLIKFKDLKLHLIAPNDIPDELKSGVRHIQYTMYDKPILRFLSSFSIIPKLFAEDYDLYHCYGEKAVSLVSIVQKIKRRRSPILLEMFEIVTSSEIESKNTQSFRTKIIRHFLKLREKIAHKQAHGIVVFTEALKDYIVKNNIYKNKIFVIPIGINLELFEKRERDLILIDKLGLKNKKIIMYAGEITPLHGVSCLVKAIEIINNKIENVELLIVGDGYLASIVKNNVKENRLNNVTFIGRVPHEEIPNYHSIADVLVIPHIKRIDSELLFPTKLLEYLASGRPIVSYNLKAIAEVVGDNAVLVEPDNPQALAEGILKVLEDEKLAKRLGKGGKRIAERYSWEKSARVAYEAYKELCHSYYNQSEKNGKY